MKTKEVAAASATYRKAVNKVAEVIRVEPDHTQYPSVDFEEISDLIDEKSKERALQWYRRGLRRGFEEACDAVVEGKLKLKDGTLYCPDEVVISVRIRFRESDAIRESFSFTSDELGFK